MEVFLERSYSFLKFVFLIFSMTYYGFTATIAIFVLHIILRYHIMKILFGLRELNIASQAMYSQKTEQRANLLGVSLVENFDAEKIKQVIIKRGLE
jgi:hypothetical protein